MHIDILFLPICAYVDTLRAKRDCTDEWIELLYESYLLAHALFWVFTNVNLCYHWHLYCIYLHMSVGVWHWATKLIALVVILPPVKPREKTWEAVYRQRYFAVTYWYTHVIVLLIMHVVITRVQHSICPGVAANSCGRNTSRISPWLVPDTTWLHLYV